MAHTPTHRIGIMQGRLLPRVGERVQAFPGPRWAEEFALAAELGYQAMELTIENASLDSHPLLSADGRARIRAAADAHHIHLAGLCCDTVMETPLIGGDEAGRRTALDTTLHLLEASAALGLPMIELPMMGDNSLRHPGAYDRMAGVLDHLLPQAERLGVTILMEVDVAPADIRAFLERVDHPRFGINYDAGNSTWFGYQPEDEIPVYARWIGNVHVKDCTRKDYSVPLGSGETRLADVFSLLMAAGYGGDFILQAARQTDDVAAARDYLGVVRKLLADSAPHAIPTEGGAS